MTDLSDLSGLVPYAGFVSGTRGVSELYAGAPEHPRSPDQVGYQRLIAQVPGILYVSETGMEGRYLYVSPQVETLLGWTPQEWMADPTIFSRSIHPDDRHVEEGAELPENTPPHGRHTSEYRLTTRDGEVRWFRDDATLVPGENGQPSSWSGVLTDITEQRNAETLLRHSNERARVVVDTAMDAYIAFDEQGTICEWNRTGEKIFGWRREEILGRSLADTLIPQRAQAAYLAEIEGAIVADESANGRTLTLNAVRRDGEELPVEVTLWRTLEGRALRFSAFLRDITERKNLEAQLRWHAYRDSVTGLANRTLFSQQVAEHMVTSNRGGFAVLVFGLDDLRSVNDSLGLAAADDLLRAVADRLRTRASASETLARLSEDEFALLLVDVATPSDARRIAEGLQDFLRSPTRCAGRELTVRASIGVRHLAPGADVGVEELLSDAGAALFTATRKGRGVSLFENSMRTDRIRRLQLTDALEQAVGRGEISVHYQPYFSFVDGRACGVEALARWHHPLHGEVHPGEFIELAEQTGRIGELGLFVLRRACRDIAALRQEHPQHRDLKLSVNVSARQLVDDHLQHELRAVLSETGLPGDALMLELTETALVEDAHVVAERLTDIRRMGVHLAVDDFGTRYASLAYLQRFPIDTLKVDRTFVRQVNVSRHDHRLTGGIITLAKTLGLRTIAEGIEEDGHASHLSGLGCDAGQGFLFARPVAIEGLTSVLSSGKQRMHQGLLSGVRAPHGESS